MHVLTFPVVSLFWSLSHFSVFSCFFQAGLFPFSCFFHLSLFPLAASDVLVPKEDLWPKFPSASMESGAGTLPWDVHAGALQVSSMAAALTLRRAPRRSSARADQPGLLTSASPAREASTASTLSGRAVSLLDSCCCHSVPLAVPRFSPLWFWSWSCDAC